jgi:transposase
MKPLRATWIRLHNVFCTRTLNRDLGNKIPQLQQALEGRVTPHHRFLLRELLDHHYFVESKMRRIEQEVAERLGPFQSEVARLCTIPGSGPRDRLGIAG